jgi:hypothetical protein
MNDLDISKLYRDLDLGWYLTWRKNTQMITEIIETSTNVYRLYALLNLNANLVLPCYLYITTVVITHTFIPAIRFWLIW